MTAVAARPTAHEVGRTAGPLAGAGTLLGFMLCRDRVRIAAWVLGLTIATIGTANSLSTLYASPADRQAIAATMDSPAGVAMVGPNYGAADYHYGVMMGHQMLWFTAILVGIMSVLLVVRHTRLEEATGRAELVRAGVVGRHAMTAAALALVAIANVLVGVMLALGLGAMRLEGVTWSGSWLYGAAHAVVGLAFAGVAIVAVQITEHSRAAAGMGIGAIGVSYAIRAVGDVSAPALSWLSPIGWAQATHVYVDDRWWPLLVEMAGAIGLAALGIILSTRRDVGAGLRRPRPGPADASAGLATPFGFAFRLHRAGVIGWTVAMFLFGTMYGSVLGDVEQMLGDIEALDDFLPTVPGVDMAQVFAGRLAVILSIVAAAYGILAAFKLRSEETAGRAEPLLATGVSQPAWVLSHVAVIGLTTGIVLLGAALGLGSSAAASLGDPAMFGRLVGQVMSHLPALWVTAGVAVLLFGVLPRAAVAAWAVVGYSFVVVYLGGLLQFPSWMASLSPFGAIPEIPLEEFSFVPLIVLTLIAAALVGAGVAAFRRRDLQSAT